MTGLLVVSYVTIEPMASGDTQEKNASRGNDTEHHPPIIYLVDSAGSRYGSEFGVPLAPSGCRYFAVTFR